MSDFYGLWDFTELANCLGDERFTGNKPDEQALAELERICKSCEVFTECLEWAEEYQVTEVFAAGEWYP